MVERAADLSDEIGLEGVTFTKLGTSLGIAPPGVYRHVADLDDLRRAIGRLASDEMRYEIGRHTAGLSGIEALTAVGETLREWASKHSGRYAALQVAPDPADVEGVASAEALVEAVGAALRAYDLRGDDLVDGVRMLRSFVHGFVTLENNGGFRNPRDVEESFSRILRSIDAVLSAWQDEPT